MALRRHASGINYFELCFNTDKPGWQIKGLLIENIVYRTSYKASVLQKKLVSAEAALYAV
jgi:hypothetical protein